MVGVRSHKGEHRSGVGKRLTEARIAQKKTIDDVSTELRIPKRQILALEQEDYSAFSAELYTRGAYTSYAKYLGVYSAGDLRAVLRSLVSVRTRVPLRLLSPDRLLSRLLNPRLVIIVAVVCIALLVGGYIAWQVESFWKLPELSITSPVDHVIQSDKVDVQGKTEARVKVTINDQQVLLQPDNSFSAQLTLHKGINQVRIQVVNASGRENVKQLFLLREK